ncbi:hypothetical protein RJ640_028699 [Escallonia rubra]|uniref:Glycosyltransferase n=1 Tax=Escallonia rubra TaxID=112253 RepID=A0AA88UJX6_9ASTE|nr:hypothetical protein RJ640_028699 [Escallonia rubra]
MKKAQLVFIPAPGVGHLISTVEIAKLLISRDERLSVTVLIMKLPFDTAVLDAYTQSLHATHRIRFIDLPQNVHVSFHNSSKSPMTFLSAFVDGHKANVRDTVAGMAARSESGQLAGFVVDMFCTSMIDVANEFGLPTYAFFTSNAAFLGLKLYLVSLNDDHNKDITEFKDSNTELSVPSFANPVPSSVLPSVAMDKEGGGSAMVISVSRRLLETKGIMVNTFSDLEAHAIKSLNDGRTPPLYPVGPIINLNHKPDDAIMSWLDDQPASSVVFLCFGSMGSFDEDQVKEIAHALERSGHRFLWALRRPKPEKEKIGSQTEYTDLEGILPEGFLERTAGIGKVIGWAPQVAVLSHQAVGGFVSHCGWNSILESVWCGVPVATWPMYAEQQVNAFQMVKELGMAVEIRLDYHRDVFRGLNASPAVTAEDIEGGIRRLMEGGSEVRTRVKEMKKKGRAAVMEGGSSYAALGLFVEDVMTNVQ